MYSPYQTQPSEPVIVPQLPPQFNEPAPRSRKRKAHETDPDPGMTTMGVEQPGGELEEAPAPMPVPKKSRTNTPWSPAEEQRLRVMRVAANNWGEIAKSFPSRTEGSVKKHWYKDMHHADFAEDESQALLNAIKEYETNKWKVIGQKVGKPAKACEQYAKQNFGMK